MHARIPNLLMALGTALWVSAVFAEVQVSFVEPQRYSDAGRDDRQSSDVQGEIARHFRQLGERYLSPGQKLKVEVLDIDLAGHERMARGGQDVRILRDGADWPRMRLRYVFEPGAGNTISGEERIADMAYLSHGAGVRRSGEYLAYEKHMLESWFKARIVERQPAPR